MLINSFVILALSFTSALIGYAYYVQGLYAEPLWLQGLIFGGFQIIVTIGVFRWISDLPPFDPYPKYKALFDKEQRAALLKMSVIFLLSPVPHLANSFFALKVPAVITIESHDIRTIRGSEKCHYRGTVSAQLSEQRLSLTPAEFHFSFVGPKRLCRELANSKDKTIEDIMSVHNGVLTFVGYNEDYSSFCKANSKFCLN